MAQQTQALTVAKNLIARPDFQEQLKQVLPKHMTPERQARVLINCMTRTPKLAECTPISLVRCMLDCSSMGLEPDGRLAHLIPYGNECTLVVDYKGLIDMIMRSGKVDFIDAFVVYREELQYDEAFGRPRFVIKAGSNPEIIHDPIIDRDPGEIIGAYAVAHVKGIPVAKFQFMRKDEIDKVKAQSRGASKPDSPWKKWYDEMAKKTAIRRLSKTLPLSSEQSEILMKELEVDGVTNASASTIPARPEDLEVDATVTEEPEPEKKPKRQRKSKPKAEPEAKQPDNVEQMPEQGADVGPPDDHNESADPLGDEPPAEPESGDDPRVEQVLTMIAKEGYSEPQFCAWARQRLKLPDTITTVRIFLEASPKKVDQIIANWDKVKDEVKGVEA